jgi:hypothetical protein
MRLKYYTFFGQFYFISEDSLQPTFFISFFFFWLARFVKKKMGQGILLRNNISSRYVLKK